MCYNNSSFGYEYCLSKDKKQLITNYRDVFEEIINAIVSNNKTRKEYIAKAILK